MYTLLIADDEILERDAIEHILLKSDLSITLYKAKNGREAVECVQQNRIDIALLDIKMPGINGIEAAKRIKEISPSTTIIFLSALNTFDFAQEAIRTGARDYLVKPVSSRELLLLLTTVMQEITLRVQQEPPQQLKTILTLFNRSFFAALKYGNISYEAMKSYFSLENIIYEQGISLIFETNKEKEVLSYLQDIITTKGYQACYFPAKDRISLLIFAHNPKHMSRFLEQEMKHRYTSTSCVGMSQMFLTLDDISSSIREASLAYSFALHHHKSLVVYSPEIEKTTASFFEKRKDLETLLYTQVIEGDFEKSRQTMHEIQEALSLTLQGDELLNSMYETILVFTRSVSNTIAHLSYPPIQKTSLLELERYVMDFIDYVCQLVQENKKDKYTSIFQQVCAYIDNNYNQAISLETLSQKFNLSTSYFSRLFSEYCNSPFSAYLTHKRIEEAKKHLDIGIKVHQVAHLVGYTDYSYFSRVFRQIVGISPKTYQSQKNMKQK
ncbi:MAG: response regulator [Spirochaetia bacterium]|nr:response regulator [Spirochaetia bacterium]